MNTHHFHEFLVWNKAEFKQTIGYFSAGLAVIAALSEAYEGQWPHLASLAA